MAGLVLCPLFRSRIPTGRSPWRAFLLPPLTAWSIEIVHVRPVPLGEPHQCPPSPPTSLLRQDQAETPCHKGRPREALRLNLVELDLLLVLSLPVRRVPQYPSRQLTQRRNRLTACRLISRRGCLDLSQLLHQQPG